VSHFELKANIRLQMFT